MDFQKVSSVKLYNELLNSVKSKFLPEKNEF